MYKIISVSDRKLCNNFEERIREITGQGTDVILREKDLAEKEYKLLAEKVMSPQIIMHTYTNAAIELGCRRIHLPMHILRSADVSRFDEVGASVHSVSEAVEAQKAGASYITAGHIFATDCKKGVPPRGLDFLAEVKKAVSIPVYAIGGINPDNALHAVNAGADGVCVMSGLMKCQNVKEYLISFCFI